ncbi:MAG: hypothetical protein ABSA44_08080 [Bacteroidota bacterium]|jgi:hypothetical protein
MITFSGNSCPSITDWLQAIGTIGAVIVALFFFFWERIREWWNKPHLGISLQFNPPDCHRIITVAQRDDGRIVNPDAFWFRLTASNKGRNSAKDLEAIISNMERKNNNTWETYSPFLPSNLKWTHISTQYLPMLLPKTEKKLDLGHIMDPNFRRAFLSERNPALTNIPNAQALFHFEVATQPSNGYNNIPPGEYRFELIVGAANCSPISTIISLSFSGNWNRQEDLMLQREINLNILK